MNSLHPQLLILGRGSSGQALAAAARVLGWQDARFLDRNADLAAELAAARKQSQAPKFLAIANPHGLHAQTLMAADALGFDALVVEKPAAVNATEVRQLRAIKTPTAVLHGYRMMWGPNALRALMDQKKLGEVFSIESRYWQSSAAERAVQMTAQMSLATDSKPSPKSWKTDPSLSGGGDVVLDLVPHALDLASHLLGQHPIQLSGKKSHAGADAPHRDTHVQLQARYRNGCSGMFSVSKIVHGASNQLQISVLGTLGSAHWDFENPDQIILGTGRHSQVLLRESREWGSGFPTYHGMGWLEGYIEVLKRTESDTKLKTNQMSFPELQSNLDLLEVLFKANLE